ncbi:manganese-dependent inorganic pyrophosphatase [Oenococcus kitaharae]|uniref:Probable manganese-dependent inorganic pyrophosphatase n=1 Tax=Oenococcus kitaharae DSM 17330 TaxID=1045004 RepID=G9WFX8_9LACO|nr:manganese-dependent inorganic pyrophosphatase [Oenococcus kitaharae]EHN59501.1 Manganese-dependent inorganic pyrophosphatase [Oenococcus kitaharae DSM 17330]OEY83361.1 inorganic pyrophosphatase [Oenococcus kitaharae]OEY85160.1 inorganic pyrophosphatase [Oenococcus kitaharae]OEY86015.1 inorganic pyrophosphatase [Oenococcus kitaharae]
MAKELVFGHQNPDTDAIAAAIAASYYLNKKGMDTEAVALGKPNDETKFALDYFKVQAPRVIEKADTKEVVLVDHNEAAQSVSNIADLTVTHVFDHHKIDFKTSAPLFYHAEALGSTSTILFTFFERDGIEIPKPIAGMMLSALISDTLLLKSPTTTDVDRKIIGKLAAQAGVSDIDDFGIHLLKAGTNLSKKTDKELIDGDAKSFELAGKTLRIGQVNTVDIPEVLTRKDGIKKEIEAEIASDGYNGFLFVITDILNSNSKALYYGSDEDKIAAAFGQTLTANSLDLPGVVSRKKQVVPPITEQFK